MLFGAVAAVFIFGPIEWLGWQYGFFIAGGIYAVGFLASLAIPNRSRDPEPAQGNRVLMRILEMC